MNKQATETGWDYVPQSFEEMQAWVREHSEIEAVAAEVIRLDDARALERRLRKEVSILRERLTHTTSILRWVVLDLLSAGQVSKLGADDTGETGKEAQRKMLVEWLEDPALRIGLGLQLGAGGNGHPDAPPDCILDCRERLPHCRAACCRRPLPLSLEEIKENKVQWSVKTPFVISLGEDGYCVHLDRKTLQCTVYENRPKACRSYTCRHDKQIWEDFEAKQVHPGLKRLLAGAVSEDLAQVESG